MRDVEALGRNTDG